MSDCIFCAIVDGDIPGRIVHETEHTLAFLDANPLAPGHTLVVPRVEAAVDADATNVGINDGPAAGQEVDHVHVHIVPRFEGDGGSPIHAVAGERPDLSDEELADIEAAISG